MLPSKLNVDDEQLFNGHHIANDVECSLAVFTWRVSSCVHFYVRLVCSLDSFALFSVHSVLHTHKLELERR